MFFTSAKINSVKIRLKRASRSLTSNELALLSRKPKQVKKLQNKKVINPLYLIILNKGSKVSAKQTLIRITQERGERSPEKLHRHSELKPY